jgi:hypothetical protein
MRIVFALLALFVAAPVAAQTCTPVAVQTLAWGSPGQDIVPAYTDKTTNLVPAGEVWIIKAAGIGQGADPGAAIEYRLQVDHQWPDGSYWYTPLEITTPQRGTPTIALTRTIILEAGERISARSNSMPNGGTMYVMALGWKLPASCLSQVMGLVQAQVSSGPNYGPWVAAVQSAVADLHALAQTAP